MNLQLAMIFTCVAIGLLAPRFGRRAHFLIGLLATAMTALYYFFSGRFM